MLLKLEQIPKRSLEVEKPDGETVTLTLKRFPLKAIPDLERDIRTLDGKRISGDLDSRAYYHEVINLVVEEYDPLSLDDLEFEHIMQISQKLQELRQNKPEAEKKSRGQ